MYFDDISVWLRPLEDFKVGNPVNELYLIARGIGKLVYDLLITTLTKETKFYYTHPENTFNTTEYSFHIPRADLVTIENYITSSQKYIPTSFQGSFDNIFVKIDGTCTMAKKVATFYNFGSRTAIFYIIKMTDLTLYNAIKGIVATFF
ncbi:hypothetical protein PHYBLDRAFT_62913 [Phycomyces blakesleeanus NRRL 1555(-)]|uniref:Uncharacterized protein n=1 Tax=Phycomyces blakesleeanus (strain ATCC 8743b / DSM 1359 / FGSC 10004 / NBRC 33097 / NRRL 1555) TaxID=763407 RepID=A0A162UPR8_PHYB8|nr:hypothetical protein PHYBLDRAFT_62913 [Phycomyces blakesleeanus NRRL 1555(-)]OAD76903.1 hypothetical protein PHYBLDRAFT_62913 [Phycomyces blakesleeanus NRRL 1555(-)]|eukprot:XP_018294943.1 hypothetical protein PHYBLDRAFT_62913 [Phycomyces blakesleeanus NRRL 1555(-)]